jgi:hypothetical protein
VLTSMNAISPVDNSPVTINFRQCPTTSPTSNQSPDPMAPYLRTGCYEAPSDFTKLICVASQNPQDRIIPAYSSSTSYVSGYYDTSQLLTDTTSPCYVASPTASGGTVVNYNPAKCATRNKTIIERGATVSIGP